MRSMLGDCTNQLKGESMRVNLLIVGLSTAMSIFAAITLSSSLAMADEPHYLTHKEACNRTEKAQKPYTCEQCKDGGMQHLDLAISELKEIDGWIEAVPPSEAEYLEREANVRQHGSKTRYFMVVDSRYYPAWNLRREVKEAVEVINKLRSSSMLARPPTDRNRGLEKLTLALYAIGALGGVSDAFREYVDRDKIRNPSVMTKDRREKGAFILGVMPISIHDYAACVVADLQDYFAE